METTFVMIKPDGVQRGLIGEIVKRFEQKGLKLKAAKLVGVSREQAEFHYAEHSEKSFYGELIDFIVSGPVFAMVWEGDQAIALSRALIGKTNILEAVPGTVRGDFVVHTGTNIIHGSDSAESAAREIGNFFAESELIAYDRAIDAWI